MNAAGPLVILPETGYPEGNLREEAGMDSEETKRSDKLGLSPGTLMHVGEKKTEKTSIKVIDYDAAGFIEKEVGAVCHQNMKYILQNECNL